jgi:tetratricopeptide (TPR) repeat protein
MPAYTEFEYDVFISYSSSDKDWVRGPLLERIEQAGLCAFIDFRDFTRGAPSIKEMERGVTVCRKTLIILTPDYIRSQWCEIEGIMLQTLSPANRDLRLIPLLKVPCERPLRISALTHIDFTESASLDLAWKQLLAALEVQPERPEQKAIPAEIQNELDRAKSLMDVDKHSEAIPILEKALIAADHANHAVARVKVRLSLAHALYDAREDIKGAERQYRDALTLVPIHNHDLRHSVLHGLGDMLLVSGRVDEARATILAALDPARKTGETGELARSLISQSLLEQTLGFHEAAATKLDEALHLLLQRELSLPDHEKKKNASALAACYLNKALLCREAGNTEEALALCGKAEKQHRISGGKLDAGKALLFRGEMHCANADWQKGFKCFQGALGFFLDAGNSLWLARAAEHISRLQATHERWEEALEGMLAAATGAEEAGHPGEQVHFLCLAAKLLRNWKAKSGKDKVLRHVHRLAKDLPQHEQAEAYSSWTAKMDEMSDAIEKAVREDEEARGILEQAKEIARRENLHSHLANCLLDEAYHMTVSGDTETQRNLIVQAIVLLKEELREAQSPKRRGHLMGRISALHRTLGESAEAMAWLTKAGEVFEKSGDVHGLANFYGSLGEIHRSEGRLDDEIAAYRKVLSLIEGRSFHDLAAGARISLAGALRYSREFAAAQRLLGEAEAICDRHHFKDFISAIAYTRSKIEAELQAAQAPAHTLPQLLASLDHLVNYRPEHAAAYLAFWYFVWKTELLALVRSGPHLSFMVVTDDVERFMKFAATFRHLADHFLMATSTAPTVKVETGILPIPADWLWPLTFPLLFMKRDIADVGSAEQEVRQNEEDDAPPSVRIEGPANMLPPYMPVEAKSDVEGEGHMMALFAPHLPVEAIDLMIRRPAEELILRRAVWFPVKRFESNDSFLTDLRTGHERGVFPVYFDRLPTSDAVTVCGGVRCSVPKTFFGKDRPAAAAKWCRALLKLTTMQKDEAQAALLDIPDVFADTDTHETDSLEIEIWLFEFTQIDRRVFHPAILIRCE